MEGMKSPACLWMRQLDSCSCQKKKNGEGMQSLPLTDLPRLTGMLQSRQLHIHLGMRDGWDTI